MEKASSERKLSALLLSALVLPGLGQLTIGRKKRGAFFIASSIFILTWAVLIIVSAFLHFFGISRYQPADITDVYDLMLKALLAKKASLVLILVSLLIVWATSILDIYLSTLQKDQQERQG